MGKFLLIIRVDQIYCQKVDTCKKIVFGVAITSALYLGLYKYVGIKLPYEKCKTLARPLRFFNCSTHGTNI